MIVALVAGDERRIWRLVGAVEVVLAAVWLAVCGSCKYEALEGWLLRYIS